MKRPAPLTATLLLVVAGLAVPWTICANLGAPAEPEYVGDSKQCAKCHGKDGDRHLPHFNTWRDTAHGKQVPKEGDPLAQQFRRSTGFVVSKAGKGDWLEKGVGCESCHGPNDPHTRAKTKEDAIKTSYAGRVAMLADAAKASEPAKAPFAETEIAKSMKAAMTCGQCHAAFKSKSGKDFPDGFVLKPDGTHDLAAAAAPVPLDPAARTSQSQYHDWLFGGKDRGLSKHASKGVWCATCHDPHANGKDPKHAQLRLPVNQLCGSCHKKEAADLQKHLTDPAQKHVAGLKVRPDMECVPCHMPPQSHGMSKEKPNHAHATSNEEARKYEDENKAALTASASPFNYLALTRRVRLR